MSLSSKDKHGSSPNKGNGKVESIRSTPASSLEDVPIPIAMKSDTLERTSAVMIENLKPRSDQGIKHKTKVSKVKPPGRIVYEWEWDIVKFDKAFPLTPPLVGGSKTTGAVRVAVAAGGKMKTLKSPKITAGSDIGRKSDWQFVLVETKGNLSWYLELCKIYGKGHPRLHTAFTMSIVDGSGKAVLQKSRCFKDFEQHFWHGWNDLIDVERLYNEKKTYLMDNTLRIRVLFEMYVDVAQRDDEAEKQEKYDFARMVAIDLNKLRSLPGSADVHMECGGIVFPVHRLILAARSPFFAKMFESSLQRAGSNDQELSAAAGDNPPECDVKVLTYTVSDIDPHIMEIVLDYVYFGNVKLLSTPQVLSAVVRAADKLELRDLKAYCFNNLMSFINEENFGQIAVLTYRHKAEKNVRVNINAYFLRNLGTLMSKKSFKAALKAEPDAFLGDSDEDTTA